MLPLSYNWIKQNRHAIIKWGILCLLMYFPLFFDLDSLPLRIWDEARLAESAYEMYKYGHYLIPHIHGRPDMWSVKPPLMIWMQVACMKIFGVGELAVRLPSAISALIVCLLIMAFCLKYLKDFWWGFAAVMVLITSHGYIWMHAERSGDYDVPLSMFITFYCLAFYAYTVTGKTKYITLTSIGIILAVLTKGVAGLLFLPALLIFAIIKKRLPGLVRNKALYINVVVFLTVIMGYYLLREHYNPGYIKAVLNDEWGGRYFDVKQGHSGNFLFYYQNFIDFQFSYWYVLVPVGIIAGLANKNSRIKDIVLYMTVLIVLYFIIVSFSQTKLIWYDVPMYPFMAIIIGNLLSFLMALVKKVEGLFSVKPPFLQLIIMGFILIFPYKTIIGETARYCDYSYNMDSYYVEYYLRDAAHGEKNLDNCYLLYDGYNLPNLFYVNIINDRGEKMVMGNSLDLKIGNKVLVFQPGVESKLLEKYDCLLIDSYNKVKLYRIAGVKKVMPAKG